MPSDVVVSARRGPTLPGAAAVLASSRSLIPQSPIPSSRRGVTLIELLLVVTIILMMMGWPPGPMQSAKDSRRNREAARAVSVYLGSARAGPWPTGGPAASC